MEEEVLNKNIKKLPEFYKNTQESAKVVTPRTPYKKSLIPRRALTGF